MTQIDPEILININEVKEEIAASAVLTNEDVDRKRKELLLLSSDGEITKSVTYINKATAKVIEKLYAEYEAKRLEKASEFLCDQFISKFAALMGGLDAIEKPEEMEKELKTDPLLRKDLKVAMAWLTPLIPFLGLLSGGATVGKYVWDKQSNVSEDVESPSEAT